MDVKIRTKRDRKMKKILEVIVDIWLYFIAFLIMCAGVAWVALIAFGFSTLICG